MRRLSRKAEEALMYDRIYNTEWHGYVNNKKITKAIKRLEKLGLVDIRNMGSFNAFRVTEKGIMFTYIDNEHHIFHKWNTNACR